MGTRSGDMDPAIMEFIAKKENLDIAGVMNVLNKKSGVLGLSGVSSDFRDIEEAAEAGNDRAAKALAAYNYRVVKYIGAYTCLLYTSSSWRTSLLQERPDANRRISRSEVLTILMPQSLRLLIIQPWGISIVLRMWERAWCGTAERP